jgi:dihydrofolate reductase / thymidylate synthase
MSFHIIVAIDVKHGIAKDGRIPWNSPLDRQFFRYMTTHTHAPENRNVVIMGRKTFESMGSKPLPNRMNVILSRNPEYNVPDVYAVDPYVIVQPGLSEALHTIQEMVQEPASNSGGDQSRYRLESVFVIGGAELYAEALSRPDWGYCYVTSLNQDCECDQFFPYKQIFGTRNHKMVLNTMHISRYVGRGGGAPFLQQNRSEESYLRLMLELYRLSEGGHDQSLQGVAQGGVRSDRTGVGTFSTFGPQLSFDLSKGFPQIVSKRTPFKMVLRELLFFLSGSTDATQLSAQKVRIWDDNTTRKFLDARGLTEYREGDMGPMYGFQWRHAGAGYKGCDADYIGQGIDQIRQMEELLKTNPHSRRIILNSHNVADLSKMTLHPCHSMFQLYVSGGKLNGKLTQRSADLFLGVPFNIASYALLIHMFARVAKLDVGTLILSFGDVHIYTSHLSAVEKLLHSFVQEKRCIIPYPDLHITGDQTTLDDFTEEDFVLNNYAPGPTIKAPMAI